MKALKHESIKVALRYFSISAFLGFYIFVFTAPAATAAILPTPGQSCAYSADEDACRKQICPRFCQKGIPRIPGALASGTLHEQGCTKDEDYINYYCNTGVCVPEALKGANLTPEQLNDPAAIPCNYTLDDLVTVGIRFAQWIIGIAGGLALLFFAYAGNQWIVSMGNPEAIQGAKKTLTAAFVGLMIILGSAFILDYATALILGPPPPDPDKTQTREGSARADIGTGFRAIVPKACTKETEEAVCFGTNMECYGTKPEQGGAETGVCRSKCDIYKGPKGYSCIQLGCISDDDCNNRAQGVTGNKCFGVQGGGGYCVPGSQIAEIGLVPTLECVGAQGRGFCERDPSGGGPSTYQCCKVKGN